MPTVPSGGLMWLLLNTRVRNRSVHSWHECVRSRDQCVSVLSLCLQVCARTACAIGCSRVCFSNLSWPLNSACLSGVDVRVVHWFQYVLLFKCPGSLFFFTCLPLCAQFLASPFWFSLIVSVGHVFPDHLSPFGRWMEGWFHDRFLHCPIQLY